MSGKSSVYEVILSPKAVKRFKRMEMIDRIRIKQSLEILQYFPPQGDIKKIKSTKGRFRLRVGQWRVIFFYDTEEKKVYISDVLPRNEAY